MIRERPGGDGGVTGDERGQGHTLEAVVAGMLLLAGIAFALQMTAVTPLSASTSSQHLENQLKATGAGVLASTAETGALEDAVLYWNGSGERFHGASDDGYYTTEPPDTVFGRALDRTYGARNVAYNVYVVYHKSNDETERVRMIFQGQPSDHAVSASRTVTLVDGDKLVDDDGTTTATTVGESHANGSFYAPDAGNESSQRTLYNLVRVEVVAWRI